jgi:hypothetical protein
MLAFLIAAAATSIAPATLKQSALNPWSNFVGHCWSGPAPGGGVDIHCFEAVYGGQHIRDRHEVKVEGKTVYAGETLYSVEGEQVTMTYWNSIGGIGRGTATANGDELLFSGDIRGTPSSASEHFTATWKKVDGGYEVTDGGRKNSLFKRVD